MNNDVKKYAVIASLGTSSPAVISYLRVCDHPVHHLVLLSNKDPNIQGHANLLKATFSEVVALQRMHINLEVRELQREDVGTPEECNEFLQLVTETINDLKDSNDYIYLNAAGGRKTMTIMLGLIAQLQLVDGIFHVMDKSHISFDKKTLDELIKRFRNSNEEEAKIIFNENREFLEPYMLPEVDTFERVRILTLPIEKTIISHIINRLLYNLKDLDPAHLDLYTQQGIVDHSAGRYSLNNDGRKFLESIHSVLD